VYNFFYLLSYDRLHTLKYQCNYDLIDNENYKKEIGHDNNTSL